ncbi:MAG: cell division protein FtsZ [Bacteroidales bacterium]|nr:cell division protein FtsZ [Bacteroidales bacterium]
MEELIKFDLPKNQSSIIKVVGIGGGGSNAVTHMYEQGIEGVDFILCNTDAQALEASPVPTKIQIGNRGLGAGSLPSVGREAAVDNIEKIQEILEKNTKMLFITAGMGGGTGTGAAPVIAQAARKLDILTVGIVTFPFSFEGRKRKIQAEEGIEELKKHVDTLLLVSNDKLRLMHGDLKLSEAFSKADNILSIAAKGIAEIITVAGYINVDFEDVKTVMKDSGKAIMGSAIAEGENRATKAVKEALSSPLLNDDNISGADNILLYITSGKEEISMDEVIEITDYIQDEAGENADIIWGNGTDETLENNISISLIATGFKSKNDQIQEKNKNKKVHILNEDKDQNTKEEEIIERIENIELIRNKEEKVETSNSGSRPILKENISEQENENAFIFDLTISDEEKEEVKNEVHEEEVKFEINKPKEENKVETIELNGLQKSISFKKSSDDKLLDEENVEQKALERINRLKALSMKLKSPEGILQLENEPAYLRKKVNISKDTSSDSEISRYSLSDSDEKKDASIKSNNSYLHDNVD